MKYYCPTHNKDTQCTHGNICKCDTDGMEIKKLKEATFTNEPGQYPCCPAYTKPKEAINGKK